jgi:hypothetical protein
MSSLEQEDLEEAWTTWARRDTYEELDDEVVESLSLEQKIELGRALRSAFDDKYYRHSEICSLTNNDIAIVLCEAGLTLDLLDGES